MLDVQNVGTGGVDAPGPHGLQPLQHLPGLPVGADDHRVSGADLIRGIHLAGSQLLQPGHHIGVVDDAAQHHAAAGFPGGLLRQLHGPADAVAETGAFRLDHRHTIPPNA